MFKTLCATIVGALIACGPADEAAGQVPRGNQGNPSPKGHEITGQLGASFNNPGLQNTLDVAWVKPLSTSASPLFADARLAAGVVSVITPTMVAQSVLNTGPSTSHFRLPAQACLERALKSDERSLKARRRAYFFGNPTVCASTITCVSRNWSALASGSFATEARTTVARPSEAQKR